jgi:ketosteroid isomerase-like protein
VTETEAFDSVVLVRNYIETAQRARQTQRTEDLQRLRSFLADDLVIKMASPWCDAPWRVVSGSADQLIRRLADPINSGSSLTTETVNAVPAGDDDVLVEQLSTFTRDGQDFVSMVCHIFTVTDGKISSIRAYRNDSGLPAG